MIDVKALLKRPINFQSICMVYPPSINDVIDDDFFDIFCQIVLVSQEELEDKYIENGEKGELLTPFEYLLYLIYTNQNIKQIINKELFMFINEQVTFLPNDKKIIIGDLENELPRIKDISELRIIDENNYFDFQNALRGSLGQKALEKPNPNEDPRIKRIKAKARYRDKIKAKQGKGLSLTTSLLSLCCMNMGLNPLNVGEISYASISPLIRTYQEKEKFEIDTSSIIAGADAKKVQSKYWIRNLDE